MPRYPQLNLTPTTTDGIFHASYREDIGVFPMLQGKVDSSKAIMQSNYVIYKNINSALTWDGNTIRESTGKIGATLGYAIVDDLKKMGVEVEEALSQKQNLEKLIINRISAFAGIESMVDFQIIKNPKKFINVVKVTIPLKKKDYYLMLSKKFVKNNPQLSIAIWNKIRVLKDSGVYYEITKKYLH